jgi:DNA invertase Pin-like site-specific DNA recombinase
MAGERSVARDTRRPPATVAGGRGWPVKQPPRARGSSATVIGYSSSAELDRTARAELKHQEAVIARACQSRGLRLLEFVGDLESASGNRPGRPGLDYALKRISAGDASGLIVTELSRMTRSAAKLGVIIQRLDACEARLIARSHGLDTADPHGRRFADLLVEISGWESERISNRTRKGLEAARQRGRRIGRAAVADYPDLRDHITDMRSRGMTLQAIADELNERGVPTVRGGEKWRHSSVQATIGYRRRTRASRTAPVDRRSQQRN